MFFATDWEVERWSHEARLVSKGDGPLNWAAGSGNSVDASSNDVIYKLNLSWQASDNLLGYFNFAQGFRPGGANTTAADDDIPDTYGPDVLDSYEIG